MKMIEEFKNAEGGKVVKATRFEICVQISSLI